MNETPVVGREKPREYKNQKKKHVHRASHAETKKTSIFCEIYYVSIKKFSYVCKCNDDHLWHIGRLIYTVNPCL